VIGVIFNEILCDAVERLFGDLRPAGVVEENGIAI
jgi:hypothetical protein